MGSIRTTFSVLASIALVTAGAASSPVKALTQAATSTSFFDDFAGPEINRAVWNVIVTGRTVNNEQQAYVDSPETLSIVSGDAAEGASNGALAVRARYRPGFKTSEGRVFDFTSGRMDTRGKMTFTYGTVAARIKLTAGQGLWPAFWALGDGPWPATGEMDIMENVGERDWTNVALHGPGYSGNTPLVSRRPFVPPDDITNWHVYSVDWTPEGLTFKVDGQTFYDVPKSKVDSYGRWAYDNPKFLIVNLAIGGQYPQAVNKVNTPYVGLPEATVDLIKADKALMLVDWVRITGR
jgi:beta-glucanase (GH16 family)